MVIHKLKSILERRCLILDGAMGTSLSKFKQSGESCDMLNISIPEQVQRVHLEFLASGSDIICTNSFMSRGSCLNMDPMEIEKLNKKSVHIAKRAIEEYYIKSQEKSDKFVAGVVGPSSDKLPGEVISQDYTSQIRGLIEGGCDIILIETVLSSKSLFIALDEYKKLGVDTPVMISFCVDLNAKLFGGESLVDVMDLLYRSKEYYNIFSVGINCGAGIDYLKESIIYLSSFTDLCVSFYPNSSFEGDGLSIMDSKLLLSKMESYLASGLINIVGGCCGTDFWYIKDLRDIVYRYNCRRVLLNV